MRPSREVSTLVGTVRNLKQLSGHLVSDIRRLEANWSVPSSSTGSSLGTRDDPLVLDDEEDKVVVRVEREDTIVLPPWAGTPFMVWAAMVTTLIEINKDDVDPNDIITDQSIDAMEDQFMIQTGVMVHRGRRIAWPPLDLEDDEVVESLVVGEGEEAEIVRDFAGEEECHELAFFTFFSLLFYCIDTCCYSPKSCSNANLRSLIIHFAF